MSAIRTNLLYFGDNLTWLSDPGRFPEESVDLVYLDPPFNSNRNYNILFKEEDVRDSEAQKQAFEDTWAWDKDGRTQQVFNEFVMQAPQKAGDMLKALVAALGHNDVTAYLTMMAPRLLHLHRVLKPTGSLYLHCDPTASHYLKVLLDSIFGANRFVNEIVWKRTTSHNDSAQGSRHYGRVHDILLLYVKSGKYTWNQLYRPYTPEYTDEFYRHVEPGTGRRFGLDNITGPGGGQPRGILLTR